MSNSTTQLSSSCLLKHPPNLLNTLLLRQKQSQQNPRLLRVQEPTSNLVLRGITRNTRRRHLPVNSPMTLNNRDTLVLDNVINSSVKVTRHTTSPSTSDHNTLSTVLNSRIQQVSLHILVRVEDVHARDFVDTGDIDLRLSPRLRRWVEEIRLVRDYHAQVAHLHGLEGVDSVCLGLGDEESGGDAVVEHDHCAAVLGVLVCGDGDGLQEVHGAVCGEGCGGTHGADEDNGFSAVNRGVDEEGGFLEGVCAVREHCAGHVGVIADRRLQGVCEVEEEGGGDIAAADVGGLHGGDVGDVEGLGDGVEEPVDAQGAGLVACCGGFVGAGTGDCSSCSSLVFCSPIGVVGGGEGGVPVARIVTLGRDWLKCVNFRPFELVKAELLAARG